MWPMALADKLKSRIDGILDRQWADRVHGQLPQGQAWPNGVPRWGNPIDDVKTFVIHETDGWPPRNRAGEFVARYLVPGHAARGEGPQLYVSSDGTIAQLINLSPSALLTWHATFLNQQALGIETGHRDGPQGAGAGPNFEAWRPLSNNAEDAPGQKFFAFRHRFDVPLEVLFCWFPTATFAGPNGANGVDPGMLFTEWQYRSLAGLARFLAELLLVPRNVPLLPWATREQDMDNPAGDATSPRFRLIALADENFKQIVAQLQPLNFTEAMFSRGQLAALRTTYHNAIAAVGTITDAAFLLNNNNKRLNRAWLDLFHVYRGFHGHGFAGSPRNGHDDHTSCPGPLFDWLRFAREIWDWWWYPFDFNAAFNSTAVQRRAYAAARRDTPLIEYFWENTPDNPPDPYEGRTLGANNQALGILGATSTPSSFRLEPDTPVYAMANGTLAAARIIRPPGANVSMSFVLVRHEIWYELDPTGWAGMVGVLLDQPVHPANQPGRIDYSQDPTTVYSLTMHLGGTAAMSFDNVVAANPDWLNRVLLRKKECDLAIQANGAVNPQLQNIPAAEFSRPAPTAANRPTSLEMLRLDKERLTAFMDELRVGRVAVAPIQRALVHQFAPTSINVLLGDFLGTGGNIQVVGGAATTGIGIHVFSQNLLPFATEIPNRQRWDPAAPANRTVRYESEWARNLGPADRDAATNVGVADLTLVRWWDPVANDLLWDLQTPLAAKLPINGLVYHYRPLEVMRWLNGVTWRSEWPKYRIDDVVPAKPRPRRVS
jgi:hypothetical protein